MEYIVIASFFMLALIVLGLTEISVRRKFKILKEECPDTLKTGHSEKK